MGSSGPRDPYLSWHPGPGLRGAGRAVHHLADLSSPREFSHASLLSLQSPKAVCCGWSQLCTLLISQLGMFFPSIP